MSEPHKHDGGVLVINPGAQLTVQDLGRPGLAHLGVTRSGAADVPAHSHANALVGNDSGGAGRASSEPGTATLEVTAGGALLRALEDVLVAVTGAPVPVWVGSVPAPFGSPIRLRAGQNLELGAPEQGLRNYIAVRGGVDVPPVLGSRATDVLSGLGPEPLTANTHLPLGPADPIDQAGFDELRRLASSARAPQRNVSVESEPNPALVSRQEAPAVTPQTEAAQTDAGAPNPASASAVLNVRVRLGPRDDWFAQAAIDALLSESFEVSQDSNRVGVRLSGPVLGRAREGELESEGLVVGAIQVPAAGQPVIFLADHPVTGGYPVVAVVEMEDVPLVAQARPGDRVLFHQVIQ